MKQGCREKQEKKGKQKKCKWNCREENKIFKRTQNNTKYFPLRRFETLVKWKKCIKIKA